MIALRRVGVRVALAAAFVLAGCEVFPVGPTQPPGIVVGEWLWPTPAPLPPGAVPVPLDAEEPFTIPPGSAVGCDAALLGSIVATYDPTSDPPVTYRGANGGEVQVTWPAGFSARLNPTLEIVAPDGKVFVREGVPTQEFGGGAGAGESFVICIGEYGPRPLGTQGPQHQ